MGADLVTQFGGSVTHADMVAQIEDWLTQTSPASVLYHPYISEAGERGPFVETNARAGFTGLSSQHRFPDLLRAVIEGIGYAARDCYDAMGPVPAEIRLTGGAARSAGLRTILSAALGASVRTVNREEAGAAGAAMIAAQAIGVYSDMDACVDAWVRPLLGAIEVPDSELATLYQMNFPAYQSLRKSVVPVWAALAAVKETKNA